MNMVQPRGAHFVSPDLAEPGNTIPDLHYRHIFSGTSQQARPYDGEKH